MATMFANHESFFFELSPLPNSAVPSIIKYILMRRCGNLCKQVVYMTPNNTDFIFKVKITIECGLNGSPCASLNLLF
jgi:hypothetical protein